ncbi:MAG: glycosyltransferase family 2 protein [Anaerolineae bacterium]|nr:glycosyltransferase [Anaerolineae bacterium]MDW8067826.1 glycosyltransferase family 2 protein [Anaerolineae bacterium]
MTSFWFRHQLGIVVFLGVLLLIAVSNLRALRCLGKYAVPPCLPRVSILVPVRNEEAVIRHCLRSLLAQDYPDFEVLVLDDGSTDGTGAVLAALAREESRLRVLVGRPLPEGWLGKHWACQQLAEAATGELLLFTDADTIHHPWALRLGVAALLEEQADLLSGFLHQRLITWGERLTVPTIFWCFFSFLPLALAHRVRMPALSLTNGQWMLFRRSAYMGIGGHAAVRNHPVDDIALGQRVKARGLRWRIVDLGDFVSCRMYASFRAALEGFTKNLFAVFDFRLAEYLFVWLWMALVTVEPLAVAILWPLGVGRNVFAFWPALLAVGEMLALWGIAMARLRFPFYLAFLYPVHILLLVFIAFRSLLWTATGRATWKGRTLPRHRIRLV